MRGKAFFFVHYEQMELPNSVSRNRTVLHPRALDGFFRYTAVVNGVNQIREVNVLDLARASGQLATTDPTVMRTLQAIQASPQHHGRHECLERSAAPDVYLAERRAPA